MKKIIVTTNEESLTVKISRTVAKRVPKKAENTLVPIAKLTEFLIHITGVSARSELHEWL